MNKRSLNTKRGIVLVTTMLSVVLTFMILSSVVYSNLGNFTLTSRFQEREAALLAAESGASYAVEKLSHDINWRGDDNKITVNKSDLYVEEHNGNVIGIIQNADGKNSAFRIKFNYEDGDGGLDNLNDTDSKDDKKFLIHSANVSVNNLSQTADTYFYNTQSNGTLRKSEKNLIQNAEAQNFTPDKTTKTIELPPYSGVVPKTTCRLVVEGFADPNISKKNIEQIASCEDNRYSMRTLETYLTLTSSDAAQNSVASCGGNLTVINNEKFRVSTQNGSKSTSINCLGNINVTSKDIDISNGTKFYYSGTQNGLKASDCQQIDVATNSRQIKALKWDDVPKADQQNNRLESGTYVWENKASEGQPARYELVRYNTVGDYSRSTGTTVRTNEAKGFIVNENELSVTFTKDIYIPGDGIIIKSASSTAGTRPIVCLQQDEGGKSPILTSNGVVRIDGATLGNGSITAEGDVYFQGPSVLESDPGVGVSIYSKGNVNITAITSTTKLVEKEIPSGEVENANNGGTNSNVGTNGINSLNKWLNSNYPGIDGDLRNEVLNYYNECFASYSNNKSPNINMDNYPKLDSLSCSNFMGFLEYCDLVSTASTYAYDAAVDNNNTSNPKTDPVNVKECDALALDEAQLQNIAPEKNRNINRLTNKKAQLVEVSIAFDNDVKYADQDISGVVYACKNININIGNSNNLNITGSVVAYGGNPANSLNSASNEGNLYIDAKRVNLVADPAYVNALLGSTNGSNNTFKKSMLAVY
ncbi:hypothetical protein IJT10_02350 [bacterium]|nr:hypothetical protein [bacterium]